MYLVYCYQCQSYMLVRLSVYQTFSCHLLMTLTHSSFLLEDVHALHNDNYFLWV